MFLDANIFIYAFHGHDGSKSASCKKFLEKLATGEQHASTSTLVIDEIVHFFLQKRGKDFALAVLRNIMENRYLSILPLDEKALSRLSDFIKLDLDASDAFHAACMRANSISTICSYDTGFDRISSINRQEPK